MVSSVGFFFSSTRILGRIFSVAMSRNQERKMAAVLTEVAMCAILKLNCNT